MQYLAALLRVGIVGIGIYMVVKYNAGTPPFLSGIVFVLIGLSLCLNRLMAVKNTPCLMKCFHKNK